MISSMTAQIRHLPNTQEQAVSCGCHLAHDLYDHDLLSSYCFSLINLKVVSKAKVVQATEKVDRPFSLDKVYNSPPDTF